MSGKRNNNHFILANERGFKALPHWLKDRGCNSYSYSIDNKINVGVQMGTAYSWRGSIVVKDEALFDRAIASVRDFLGFPPLKAGAEQ